MAQSSKERLARWEERWRENNIGWHQQDVSEALLRFGNRILPSSSSEQSSSGDDTTCQAARPVRIFFPLCGKTVDMAWAANDEKHDFQVEQVVGVDGVLKSLETFAEEQAGLQIQKPSKQNGAVQHRLDGKKISLIQADFFTITSEDTGGRFEAIYDRASLVAINPTLREDYVKIIGRLLAPQGRILLVALERTTGDVTAGPPFSFTEADVRKLYEPQQWVDSVTLLEEEGEKAFKDGDGRGFRSRFFLIQGQ